MACNPPCGRLGGYRRGHNPVSDARAPGIPCRRDATSDETRTGVGRSPGDADSATRPAEVALRLSGLARLLSLPDNPTWVVPADRSDRDKDQDGLVAARVGAPDLFHRTPGWLCLRLVRIERRATHSGAPHHLTTADSQVLPS